MAILTEVPGLSVAIEVAGKSLTEYEDDGEEPQPLTRTVYVQAESGAKFMIAPKFDHHTFPHGAFEILFAVDLDGMVVCNTCFSPTDIRFGTCRGVSLVRRDLGDRYVYQEFSFAQLDIVEGSADMSLKGKLDALGTITVKFYRVRREDMPKPKQIRTPLPAKGLDALKSALLETGEVPEKNLKGSAVSHQAKLSTTNEVRYDPAIERMKPKKKTTYIDKTPFATFNFKYRSRAALRMLQMIEQTPPPVALEDRPIGELTPEELRQLVARQKEQLTQRSQDVKIKREKRDRSDENADPDDELEITSIDSTERKKMKLNHDAVIYISDDE